MPNGSRLRSILARRDATQLAPAVRLYSASATVHTLHVQWAKVAMCGERTQVIFVFVLPLDETVRVCVVSHHAHRPCVSDAHDMVLVVGALEGMAGALREAAATLHSLPQGNQGQTRSCRDVLVRQTAMPSRPVPRNEEPPVAPAAPAEMQRGEPSSSEPAPPRPATPSRPAPRDEEPPVSHAAPAMVQRGEPSGSESALPLATAPVDVALASDDSHLARYTPRPPRRAELCEVSTGPPLWALPPPPQGQAPKGVATAPRLEQLVPAVLP